MKTICFLTPCHPARPNMQKICFNSVKAQTCDDYQHFLLQGSMRENKDGTRAWECGLKKPWPIDARYVMRLDDDNMLVYPDFVKEFKQLTQKENPDVVIFRGNIIGIGIIPSHSWGKAPVHGNIDWFCYAIKLEMWNKYIQEMRHERGINNDYQLIRNCYRNTQSVSWMDRVVAKTQRGRMYGKGE